MPLLQLIILAIIQGLTEFIPVSSSAHLVLAHYLVPGWQDQGPLIDIAAHVGTLGAVMIYFRKETGQLVTGGIDVLRLRDSQERTLFLLLALATVPLVIAGGLLYLLDATWLLRNPFIIGTSFIVFGILLWIADRPKPEPANNTLSIRKVALIGLAQALAIIPGASRSGVTITAARFLGMARPEAARFSMLLSIPAILISGAVVALDIIAGGATATASDALIVVILSFLAGYAAIFVFMKMAERMSFTPFVIYRLVFGTILIAVALI
ncbi:undecaprenyl-diphosphate phosphatase [Aquisalinus flavus]|uniref:Undecaprenyl-diphosphatase n=1 Tax=Aquisalinus flavus TaxID=1526572 RepID=A0A8J2V3H8_9PROT|nr:undecaprenyl-diphosphate phosphatase [Aquisalinus flavus]MBD0425813.1 undecaprenyl-diphosphate phosphatase [Aquisalinus flavus]UNE48582.1 undecaprenyl-diphosphate phosphatase [Aquisalinus flavus]GGD13029.1 undecaprenyl-diphosphatase [Aquisalinus flavus]